MSNHNYSGSLHEAESESSRDNQQKPSETAQHRSTTIYEAPYYRNQGPFFGSYLVMFHRGRTVATHFAILGRKFDVTNLNEGYFADLDDGLLNAVRRDLGVPRVEDNVDDEADMLMEQSLPEAIQHAYQAPYEPAKQCPRNW